MLKPGGGATLSTEFRIRGPDTEKIGIRGTILFTRSLLEEYVVRSSGLQPVDEIDYTVTQLPPRQRIRFVKQSGAAFAPSPWL